MSEANKWKSKLLSSSVPLEHQVAKLLVSSGYSVNTDFSYSRYDGGVVKDFSVDLNATNYISKADDHLVASINLLVECKYRHPNNKWLFFEDVNREDFSASSNGETIRAIDDFSWKFLPRNCTASFDEMSTFCMKGVEIDLSSGNVFDSEIQHGLKQLQYGLPSLITNLIGAEIYNPPDENLPFFYCPILLTTSDIHVASKDTTLDAISKCEKLEDFTEKKPWITAYSQITPEFIRHRQNECSLLSEMAKLDFIEEMDASRMSNGKFYSELPSNRFKALSESLTPFPNLFSKMLVCTLDSLPKLVLEVEKTVTTACEDL